MPTGVGTSPRHDRRGPERKGAAGSSASGYARRPLPARVRSRRRHRRSVRQGGRRSRERLPHRRSRSFLSYDAKIPAALQQKLLAAVASANKNGYPVKVALIWSRYDLGSVPELFGKPTDLRALPRRRGREVLVGRRCAAQDGSSPTTRLVVVMPNGLGFAQWKHKPDGRLPNPRRDQGDADAGRPRHGSDDRGREARRGSRREGVDERRPRSHRRVRRRHEPDRDHRRRGRARSFLGFAALLLIRRRAARSALR